MPIEIAEKPFHIPFLYTLVPELNFFVMQHMFLTNHSFIAGRKNAVFLIPFMMIMKKDSI